MIPALRLPEREELTVNPDDLRAALEFLTDVAPFTSAAAFAWIATHGTRLPKGGGGVSDGGRRRLLDELRLVLAARLRTCADDLENKTRPLVDGRPDAVRPADDDGG